MRARLIKPKGQTCESSRMFMAKDWQIRKRRPVRRKHIAPLLKDLEEALGIDLAVDGAFLEMADYGSMENGTRRPSTARC